MRNKWSDSTYHENVIKHISSGELNWSAVATNLSVSLMVLNYRDTEQVRYATGVIGCIANLNCVTGVEKYTDYLSDLIRAHCDNENEETQRVEMFLSTVNSYDGFPTYDDITREAMRASQVTV